MNRAYNRHKQKTKFLKRVEKWFCSYSSRFKREYIEEALTGKGYTFLRTTGRPCNCEGCTYLKHKRTPKHKVIKEAFKD